MTTFGTLFLGFGGSDIGAQAAGLTGIWGIEHDPAIAEVARQNFPGTTVITGDVRLSDEAIAALGAVDVLLASPPCQAHSHARSRTLPEREDADAGLVVLDYVRVLQPKAVIVENVAAYAKSVSCQALIFGLEAAGYAVDAQAVNAADFGVPQTRRRLVIRALRKDCCGDAVPTLPVTHGEPGLLPYAGWHDAVIDLLPGLPSTTFAPWQASRLPAEIGVCLVTSNTSKNDSGKCVLRRPSETAPSVCGSSLWSRFSLPCRIAALSPHVLARFQAFPDWYQLPEKAALAVKGIANAVPPLLMQRVVESLLPLLSENIP